MTHSCPDCDQFENGYAPCDRCRGLTSSPALQGGLRPVVQTPEPANARFDRIEARISRLEAAMRGDPRRIG